MTTEAYVIPMEGNALPLPKDSKILSEDEMLRLKSWISPVDEVLWAKLQEQVALLRLIAKSSVRTEVEKQIFNDCLSLVEEARYSIERRKRRVRTDEGESRQQKPRWRPGGHHWPFTENNSLFWRIVHEIDENMLLIMPREMLAAQARSVKQDFELNIDDRLLRRTWLGNGDRKSPLVSAVDTAENKASTEEDLLRARYVLRTVLHTVNEHADQGFRQLAANMLVRTWSGVLLGGLITTIVVIFFSLPETILHKDFGIVPPVLLFLGAAGAVAANMMSKHAFIFSAGPTRRYFVFYLLIRPVVGAFSALVLYVLWNSTVMHTLGLEKLQKENWHTYFLLALAAGYSAERFLGLTIDKVMTTLFKTADKTQRAPSPMEKGAAEA